MGMLRERGRAITRLLPAAVMNTEYRANKRLYEFTERGEGGRGNKKGKEKNANRAKLEERGDRERKGGGWRGCL